MRRNEEGIISSGRPLSPSPSKNQQMSCFFNDNGKIFHICKIDISFISKMIFGKHCTLLSLNIFLAWAFIILINVPMGSF
mmetsp:Transcript_3967/g.10044  ORF Transcript_3967/g.10044 Transcript_3967/m.10044 type:complete len:80 (+) Transcript_3967:1302-1541(+)